MRAVSGYGRAKELRQICLILLRRWVMKMSIRFLPVVEAAGMRLVIFSGHQRTDFFVSRVSRAMEMIAMHDRRRHERIRRDIKLIALVAAGGDYFDPDISACVLDLRSLEGQSVDLTASSLVHEACHARLIRRGIPYSALLADRIEHLCVGEEIDFVRRLPDGEHLAPLVGRKLEHPWWSRAQMGERMRDQLRSYGLPRWMIGRGG